MRSVKVFVSYIVIDLQSLGFHKKFAIDSKHQRPFGCQNMKMDDPAYKKTESKE